jgi:hypothetical protein
MLTQGRVFRATRLEHTACSLACVPCILFFGCTDWSPLQKMIEDLKADSKRWDEELRRSRNRGPRPGSYDTQDTAQEEMSNAFTAYEDTMIHERRQISGPSQNISGYTGYQGRLRERDDHDMDDYARPGPAPPRTLFPVTLPLDYPPHYPVTSGAYQNPPMTAAPDYVLGRGQTDAYGQVPRSQYEMYAAGRGATLQPTTQGPFATQQGLQSAAPYQDPRTGQIIYPSTSAGRGGYDQLARHTGAADGRRH